jgi:HAD superfamily hydrolase (TIGR01509 family)
VVSALLLDVGFVIIDVTPESTRAYEQATGKLIPGLADAAAARDWDEVGRSAGLGDMVGLFRALATVAPETLFVPEAVALIEEAHDGGVPVGVLTNHAYAILEPAWFAGRPELALLRTFIDAAAIGYPKPDPQGYRIAAAELGVRPEEVVFLDDTPECVDGARAVGMTAIIVDPDDRLAAFDEARRILGLGA